MRLLILGDPHGSDWKINELIQTTSPDVIIIPGDLPSSIDYPVLLQSYLINRGNRTSYVKQLYERYSERIAFRQIMTAKKLMEQIEEIEIPVLLIHGNTEAEETRNWLELYCKRYPQFNWISDNSIQIDDILFIGYGWVSYPKSYERYPSPGEIPIEMARSKLDQIIKTALNGNKNFNKSILISHAPPFGTNLDYLPHKAKHAGSLEIRDLLNEKLIEGIISGHLHESRGIHVDKDWWGINAGALAEDNACLLNTDNLELTWYKNVISKTNLSYLLYTKRSHLKYDKKRH